MLPTTMLQFSDFATFETELNSPNLLPEDATEPQIAFADLLGLSAERLPEPTLPTGLTLPDGGNQLPAPPSLPTGLPEQPAVTAGAATLPVTTRPATVTGDLPAALEARLGPSAPIPALPAVTTPAPVSQPASRAAAPLSTGLPVADNSSGTTSQLVPALQGAADELSVAPTARPQVDVVRPESAAPARPAVEPFIESARQTPPPVTPVADPKQVLTAGAATSVATPVPADRRPLASRPASEPGRLPETAATDMARDSRPQQPLPMPVNTGSAQSPVVVESAPLAATQSTTTPLTPSFAAQAPETPAPMPTQLERIDVAVQERAWGEQLGQRLQLMASNRLQTAEIRLSPAELGPLRVQVAMDDGAANVTFHAQHAITREAIEQALPRLREMLAEHGLQLNQANIGEQGVQHGGRQAGEETRGLLRTEAGQSGDAEAEESGSGLPRQRDPDGLVDTFA